MLHVVIGIIFNSEKKVLIAKRQAHQEKGGLWEFPGGKLEVNETPFDALKRELKEEINIDITHATSWLQFPYSYSNKTVFLDTWKIEAYSGMVIGAEGQEIKWVDVRELKNYEFPGGNKLILTELNRQK